MAIPWFPRRLLRERMHSWNLSGVAASPGQLAQPYASLIRSDGGGYWTCVMTDVSLSGVKGGNETNRQRQRIATLLWRAVRQLCDGGINKIVVPRNDALFRPWPSGVAQGDFVDPHSDGAYFSDGSGYYQPVIDIMSDGAAALRATRMDIAIAVAGDLIGGESFSIRHESAGWRIYEIATVEYSDPAHATITFLPPLREAIVDATSLEFDRPCCTMQLAKPNSMDLAVIPWTFNQASVDFVEAPTA